ncbi:yippee-domain-containing protein [Patellaria atrata CBS 101060]|uniref:Yippee-domain-containing protein n=1 Tax=Patellaria atrata CBS 101060 TaxID=1346257 RepID=A0A9P4S3M7_9PEZI|nr:yippee-domain-containing protein [Patellaria atrata CBS 101060]
MPFSSTPPISFPTYLLPSLPFRRRRSSSTTTTTTSSSSSSSSSSSPSSPPTYLTGSTSRLRCTRCLTDLCHTTQIISKGFTGRHGRAYLVTPSLTPTPALPASPPPNHLREREVGNLPNTHTHKPVPRQLVTGAHTVSDVSCAVCGSVLGWKYVAAEEPGQQYKVGKFILETKRVCRGVCWESAGDGGDGGLFDSQDEEECEDLFAGVWSPSLAKRRRRQKGFGWRGRGEEE